MSNFYQRWRKQSLVPERLYRVTGRIITKDVDALAPENLEHLTQIKNNQSNK